MDILKFIHKNIMETSQVPSDKRFSRLKAQL